MQLKNETRTGLTAEIRIVPPWAWTLAAIAFLAAQWFFNIALPRQLHAPPAWARPLLGLLAGMAAACYLLYRASMALTLARRRAWRSSAV